MLAEQSLYRLTIPTRAQLPGATADHEYALVPVGKYRCTKVERTHAGAVIVTLDQVLALVVATALGPAPIARLLMPVEAPTSWDLVLNEGVCPD